MAHEPSPAQPLEAPAVDPGLYDETYYRQGCAGSTEWHDSEGEIVAGLYPGMLRLARFREGEVLVDVGAGRGELVALAAELGARRAHGYDYSPDAVRLAQQTLRARGVEDRAEVEVADARRLPLGDDAADLVTMLDVVEHLAPAELADVLQEARRVLRPGGRLFAHTMPNRLVYDVAYRTHRAVMNALGARWPADPRSDYERSMHVNEQTVDTLGEAVRQAGFRHVRVTPGRWVLTAFLPDQRHAPLYEWAARVPGIRRYVLADLFATAWC